MDRIILVAQQLAKEGKTPNTALIKARLPKNIPLPSIIQGLKLWQEDPNKHINNPSELSSKSVTIEQGEKNIDEIINGKISLAISPLKEQIERLKEQVMILESTIRTTQSTTPSKSTDQ